MSSVARGFSGSQIFSAKTLPTTRWASHGTPTFDYLKDEGDWHRLEVLLDGAGFEARIVNHGTYGGTPSTSGLLVYKIINDQGGNETEADLQVVADTHSGVESMLNWIGNNGEKYYIVFYNWDRNGEIHILGTPSPDRVQDANILYQYPQSAGWLYWEGEEGGEYYWRGSGQPDWARLTSQPQWIGEGVQLEVIGCKSGKWESYPVSATV